MSNESEAICEVVQITEVLPHPNADKLEIAHFRTKDGPSGYTCVIGKGQFHVGDLAVYCGVDCVVPLTNPKEASRDVANRWKFLTTRLDGQGKDRYRIKAARLRGVYSEGVLMEPNTPGSGVTITYPLGAEFWKEWGITYYEVPTKLSLGPTAPAQNTVKAHWRRVFPEYGVLSLRKVPYLFEEGEEVVVTEKIHGTNARFGWVPKGWFGHKFLVGSHRMIKTDLRNWFQRLVSAVKGQHKNKGFYGHDLWSDVARKYDLANRLKDYPGLVFYGEVFGYTLQGGKIQDLTYGDGVLRFRVFDIWDTSTQKFLDPWERAMVCADVELDMVPYLYTGPYNAVVVKNLAEGKTTLSTTDNQIREGVVIETASGASVRKKAKLVGEGYRTRKTIDEEVNSEAA